MPNSVKLDTGKLDTGKLDTEKSIAVNAATLTPLRHATREQRWQGGGQRLIRLHAMVVDSDLLTAELQFLAESSDRAAVSTRNQHRISDDFR